MWTTDVFLLSPIEARHKKFYFQDTVAPFPLKMSLVTIDELFTSTFMQNVTNNYGEQIDYEGIATALAESRLLSDYCINSQKSLGIETCDVTLEQGCSWQSDCKVYENCVDDLAVESHGFRYQYSLNKTGKQQIFCRCEKGCGSTSNCLPCQECRDDNTEKGFQ